MKTSSFIDNASLLFFDPDEPILNRTGNLPHFAGLRYDLDEFSVMPNHAHALVKPYAGYDLSEIEHSWKSYTTHKINKKLRITGMVWQKESFDHIVRSPEQLERIGRYIRENSIRPAFRAL